MIIEKIINEINAYSKQEGCSIQFPYITEKPNGEKQSCEIEMFDHEYVDQYTGYTGDDFSGTIAYPIGNGKYLEMSYSM